MMFSPKSFITQIGISAVVFIIVVLLVATMSPVAAQIRPVSSFSFKMTSSGLLLAKESGSSAYGTVCDDGFSQNSAQYFCKMFGKDYTGATYTTNKNMSATTGLRILLRYVRCPRPTDSKTTFNFNTDCSFYRSSSGCTSRENIVLDCRNKTDYEFKLGGDGILWTRPLLPAGKPWGTVSAYAFASSQRPAKAICAAMGLTATSAADFTTLTGPVPAARAAAPIYLSSMSCSSDATGNFFKDCTYDDEPRSYYRHSYDAVLLCQPKIDYKLRLRNGAPTADGSVPQLLEVQPLLANASSLARGYVCDRAMSSSTSRVRVLCGLLGLPTGDVSIAYNQPAPGFPARGYSLSYLSCYASSSATITPGNDTLAKYCSYRQTNYSCYGRNAVALTCLDKVPYTFQLRASDHVLVARPASAPATAPFAPVCYGGYSFSDRTASTVCSLLGKSSGSATFSREIQPSGTKFSVAKFYCSSSAANLSQCQYSASALANCNSAIAIHCDTPNGLMVKIMPDGDVMAARTANGVPTGWGTVCRTSVTDTDTVKAMCRMQNKPYSTSYYTSYYSSTKVLVSNVRCPRTAANFSRDCTYSTTSTSCSTSRRMRIYCRGTMPPSYQVKLESGTNRVLYRGSTSQPFGTVCTGSSSNKYAAQALCRQLGNTNVDNAQFVPIASNTSLPRALYSIYCRSSSSQNIATCDGNARISTTSSDCRSADLAVVCNPKLEYTLSKDNFVMRRLAPTMPWAPIAASSSFGAAGKADVLCKLLLGAATATPYGEIFTGTFNASAASRSSSTTRMCPQARLNSCSSTATSWTDCSWSSYTPSCYEAHMGLRCFSTKANYQVSVEAATGFLQMRRTATSAPSYLCYASQTYYPSPVPVPMPMPITRQPLRQEEGDDAKQVEEEEEELGEQNNEQHQQQQQQQQQEERSVGATAQEIVDGDILNDDPAPRQEEADPVREAIVASQPILPTPNSGISTATMLCGLLNKPTGATQTIRVRDSPVTGYKINFCSSATSMNGCSIYGPSNINKCSPMKIECHTKKYFKFYLSNGNTGTLMAQPLLPASNVVDKTKPPGTVCSRSFSSSSTNICRMLGLPTEVTRTLYSQPSPAPSTPIYLQGLNCGYSYPQPFPMPGPPTGGGTSSSSSPSSTTFAPTYNMSAQCAYSQSNTSCSTNSNLGFSCTEKTRYKFQLVQVRKGTDSNEGLLTVWPVNRTTGAALGPAGTVCATSFYSSYATNICRLLGKPYSSSCSFSRTQAPSVYSKMYLKYLRCYSSTRNISECSFTESSSGCSSADALYIRCVGGSNKFDFYYGEGNLLLAKQQGSYEYGGVCATSSSSPPMPSPPLTKMPLSPSPRAEADSSPASSTAGGVPPNDGFASTTTAFGTTQAIVACRSLGLPSSSASAYQRYVSSSSLSSALYNLRCSSSSLGNLSACTWQQTPSSSYCSSSMTALSCNGRLQGPTTFRKSTTLFNGTKRLEAQVAPWLPWKPICYSALSGARAVAGRMCAAIRGQATPVKTAIIFAIPRGAGAMPRIPPPPKFGSKRPYSTASMTPSEISYLSCSSTVPASAKTTKPLMLSDCFARASANQGHCQAAGLICSPNYQFKLYNKSVLLTRAVDSTTGESSPWGFACMGSSEFTRAAAQAVCKAMKLPWTGALEYRGQEAPRGTIPIIGSMDCTSSNVADCTIHPSRYYCSPRSAVSIKCMDAPSDPNAYSVRLQDGSTPTPTKPVTSGAVVITRGSGAVAVDGIVCTSSISYTTAQGLCSIMKLPNSGASYSVKWQQTTPGPILISRLDCPSNAKSLADCQFQNTSIKYCSSNSVLQLTCKARSQYDVRVSPVKKAWPLVEVRPRITDPTAGVATWATVCARGTGDPNQLCRLLGLPTGAATVAPMYRAAGYVRFGPTMPTTQAMSYLNCSSTAKTINDCDFRESTYGCGQHDDLVLFCPKPQKFAFSLNISTGLVQAQQVGNATAPLVAICNNGGGGYYPMPRYDYDDGTSDGGMSDSETIEQRQHRLAQQICRFLKQPVRGALFEPLTAGSGGGGIYPSPPINGGDGPVPSGSSGVVFPPPPVALSNLSCPRYATSFADCTWAQNQIGCSRDGVTTRMGAPLLGVICRDKSEFDIRIDPYNGQLSVKPMAVANASWGSVCTRGFTSNDARVICRFLGKPYSAARWRSTSARSGLNSVYLSRLSCPTSPPANSLYQCSYSESPSSTYCTRRNVVQLTCEAAPAYQYSIESSVSKNVLLVRKNSTAPWSQVCSAQNSTAPTLCRLMGLEPTGAYFRSVHNIDEDTTFGGTWKVTWLACPAYARTTGDCQSRSTTSYGCSRVMALFCGVPPTPPSTTTTPAPSGTAPPSTGSPTPAPTPRATYLFELAKDGRLRARQQAAGGSGGNQYNAKFFDVCSVGTKDINSIAKPICSSLGYDDVSNARAATITAPLTVPSDPSRSFVLAGINCKDNTIGSCNWTADIMPPTCTNRTVVAVYCNSASYYSNGYFFKLSESNVLMARPSELSSWSVVDPASWGTDVAAVMCATVGRPSASASFTTKQVSSKDTTSTLGGLYCPVNSNNDFAVCSGYTAGAVVATGATTLTAAVLQCPTASVGGYMLRLGTEHRLEIAPPSAPTKFGSVCNSGNTMDVSTARAACRMLGFTAVSMASFFTVGGLAQGAPTTLDNLKCAVSATSLTAGSGCTFSTTPAATCAAHAADVALDCTNSMTSPVTAPISGAAPSVGPAAPPSSPGAPGGDSSGKPWLAPVIAVLAVAALAGAYLVYRNSKSSADAGGEMQHSNYHLQMNNDDLAAVNQRQFGMENNMMPGDLGAGGGGGMGPADERMSVSDFNAVAPAAPTVGGGGGGAGVGEDYQPPSMLETV